MYKKDLVAPDWRLGAHSKKIDVIKKIRLK
jgi:hypothetical protein